MWNEAAFFRLWVCAGLAAVLTALGWSACAVAAPHNLPTQAICAAEVAQAERAYGIPAQLLDAISLVESGRYDPESKAVLAWPWTVMAEGEGRYFSTKAEAVAEVKKLKARGVKNIDVGCMQVNMMWHGQAFASLEEAFEPSANVGYAARFLKGLFQSTNHWPTAASYYHSQTPSLAANYRAKLMKVWNGGGSRNAIASLTPREPGEPATKPRPPSGRQSTPPKTEEKRPNLDRRETASVAQQREQDVDREEARRIANAYRQARLVEYQLRRVKMQEMRQGPARKTVLSD